MVWPPSGDEPLSARPDALLTLGAAKRRARDAPAAPTLDSAVRQQVQRVLEQERAQHRAQLQRMERRIESVERQALQSNASMRSHRQMLSSGSVRGVGAPDRPSEQQPEALAALGAPLEWSVHQVAVWLRLSVGLPDYVSIFVVARPAAQRALRAGRARCSSPHNRCSAAAPWRHEQFAKQLCSSCRECSGDPSSR